MTAADAQARWEALVAAHPDWELDADTQDGRHVFAARHRDSWDLLVAFSADELAKKLKERTGK